MPTRTEYAKINIACKELGIDKYQLLLDRYGLDSSKDLTRRQVWDLLAHFKSLGWKVKRSRKRPTSPVYVEAQRRKIVGLWITLADAEVVRNRSDKALQAYVKRMTGVDNLAWCRDDQVQAVCQALVEWCNREKVPTDEW